MQRQRQKGRPQSSWQHQCRAQHIQPTFQAGSSRLQGAAPCLRLKLTSLRRASCINTLSATHSLWWCERPTYLTKYSGSSTLGSAAPAGTMAISRVAEHWHPQQHLQSPGYLACSPWRRSFLPTIRDQLQQFSGSDGSGMVGSCSPKCPPQQIGACRTDCQGLHNLGWSQWTDLQRLSQPASPAWQPRLQS